MTWRIQIHNVYPNTMPFAQRGLGTHTDLQRQHGAAHLAVCRQTSRCRSPGLWCWQKGHPGFHKLQFQTIHFPSFSAQRVENSIFGAREMTQQMTQLLFHRFWVQYPPTTWWLTSVMGSNPLFWYSWKGSTNIYKINTPLKKEKKRKFHFAFSHCQVLPWPHLSMWHCLDLLGNLDFLWYSLLILTPLNIPIKRLSQQHPAVTLHGTQSTALQTGEYLAGTEVHNQRLLILVNMTMLKHKSCKGKPPGIDL